MKNFKVLMTLAFVVGLLGISPVFACKFPGANLPTAAQRNSQSNSLLQSAAKEEVITIRDGNSFGVFTKRDLAGRYASYATVTIFDPSMNRTLHGTCVGVVTFDGRGRFTDREVHSYDGAIVRDDFTGTYTVNPDGTGVMHFISENETFDYQFVISNDGKEITFLVTFPEDVPGVVSQGTLKKQ